MSRKLQNYWIMYDDTIKIATQIQANSSRKEQVF